MKRKNDKWNQQCTNRLKQEEFRMEHELWNRK